MLASLARGIRFGDVAFDQRHVSTGQQEGVGNAGAHSPAAEHADPVGHAGFAAITKFQFRNRH
jgi:hypothetical protein